ncbi:hypothetical protein GCM10022223_10460 [Kineosporia mesophila]|uniref:non-specific serine/threonine protein kinase n=2 Tax=Kineosporia mesophila TaxID=566012 RepID=A0ABP6Z3B3_9ACTN
MPGTDTSPNGWYAGPASDPDRYQLLGTGLSGGEGNIWRARYRGRLTSPLTVAVKQLRRPLHAGDDWPTANDLRRWEDQRALLTMMRFPHLVSLLDIFTGPPPHPKGSVAGDGPTVAPYVVMEWVPGRTLADELGGVPATGQNLVQRLGYVVQVAEALDALHSHAVSAGNPSLHRDVKPANCILSPGRGVVLVDVGTMRRVDDGRDMAGRYTPAYTAPEVLADPLVAREPASDFYSLGCLAYFCITGDDPSPAHGLPGTQRLSHRLLLTARAAGVTDPAGFTAEILRMLAVDPAVRPPQAQRWAAEVLAKARPRKRYSRRLAFAAVLVPLLVVVSLIPWLFFRPTDTQPLLRPGQQASSEPPSPPPGPPPAGPGPAPGPPPPGPPPGGDQPPGGPSGPEGTIMTDDVAFASPRNGDTIGRCPQVTGASRLPPGHTLLLSAENLTAGDRIRHVTPVDGWRRPNSLSRWRVRPSVGLPSDPPGERYRLELIVAPLPELRAQADSESGFGVPVGSYVGASIFVSRKNNDVPGC